MIEESYQEWYSRITAYSNLRFEQYLALKNRDIDDWEGKACAYYNSRITEGYSGIVFEGNPGTGKHTALSSFLYIFSSSEGYGYQTVFLDMLSLPETREEYVLFESHMFEFADSIKESKTKTVMVIEDVEANSNVKHLLNLLPLLSSYCSEDAVDLVYMVVSNTILDIPSLFSKATCRFIFSSTNYKQRKNYLELFASSLLLNIEIDRFLSIVGECTFGELTDIVRALTFDVISGQTANEKRLIEIVDKYCSYKRVVKTKNTTMDTVFERLESLMTALPKQTFEEKRIVQNNIQALEQSHESPDNFINVEVRRKQYDEMLPCTLMAKVYGEDGVKEIVNSVTNK